jgi:anti-sigma factor RsiW
MAQLHVQLDQTQQQLAAAQQPQPWIMQVAQYHKIYAREQRHLVEVSAAETPHIEQWLGKRLDDLAFKVPDLSAFGLTFKGARMLVVNGAPVAQLVYLPADGRAVALCIIHSKKGDKPLTASQGRSQPGGLAGEGTASSSSAGRTRTSCAPSPRPPRRASHSDRCLRNQRPLNTGSRFSAKARGPSR